MTIRKLDDNLTVEIYNKYFSSISNLNDENKILPDFDCRCLNVLSDIEVCEQDVIDIISTLNVDKAVEYPGRNPDWN
jgi:hypothetical protein